MNKKSYEYQEEFASMYPSMYDRLSREHKAKRMILTLEKVFFPTKLKRLTLLDVGASTGIIDNVLASRFGKVVGTDIDGPAIKYAQKKFKKKGLSFRVADAMNLKFANNSFDVVICTHVYEHVPESKKLFSEVYRVLKPRGICYLAAMNSLWPIEPHHKLLFLSWLPKNLAHWYMRLAGKGEKYYESPLNYWQLNRLLSPEFTIHNYTEKIWLNPSDYGYGDSPLGNKLVSMIAKILSPFANYLAPTMFLMLEKHG